MSLNSVGTLKYGSKIQLFASSALADHGLPHAVTNYKKHNLLSLGAPNAEPLTFLVIPTTGANGGDVCYGHRVILVEVDSGCVLNSESNTWNKGYICLRNKEFNGELHVIFRLTSNPYCDGQPMNLSDIVSGQKVLVEVISSRSNKVDIPTPLTVTKRASSAVAGGYLIWDGSGNRVTFNIKQVARIQEARSPVPPTPQQLADPRYHQEYLIAEREGYPLSTERALSPDVQDAGDPAGPLRYGDRVRLLATSHYSPQGGYVGMYHKHNLVGVGPCDHKEDFTVSEFVVVSAGQARTGEVVRYCAGIVLVDVANHSQVWNNRDPGTWGDGYVTERSLATNSVTPRMDRVSHGQALPLQTLVTSTLSELVPPAHVPAGQMHVSLQPPTHTLLGFPVHNNDAQVSIDVEDSHRTSTKYNCRLSVYRKSASLLRGGYLMSLPSFEPVTFTVQRSGCGIQPPLPSATSLRTPGVGVAGRGTGAGLTSPLQRVQSVLIDEKPVQVVFHPHPPLPPHHAPVARERTWVGGFVVALLCAVLAAAHANKLAVPLQGASPALLAPVALYGALALAALAMHVRARPGTARRALPPDATIALRAPPATISLAPAPTSSTPSHSNSATTPATTPATTASRATASAPTSAAPPVTAATAASAVLVESSVTLLPSTPTPVAATVAATVAAPPASLEPCDWETDPENCPVPQRYLNAEKGDLDKARARYLKTMQWRKVNGIDTILSRPHPLFRVIKKHTNQFFCGRGLEGSVVYYETPKAANLPALQRLGVTIDDLLYHFVYISEYLYQRLDVREDAQCISVVDCTGIGLSDFGGAVVDFVKKVAAITQTHYPERSFSIVCINSPLSFRFVWNLVKGFMDPVTREKTHIYGSNFVSKMSSLVAADQIPRSFRGNSNFTPTIPAKGPTLPTHALRPEWNDIDVLPLSADEEELFKLVDRVNEEWVSAHPGEPLPHSILQTVEDLPMT